MKKIVFFPFLCLLFLCSIFWSLDYFFHRHHSGFSSKKISIHWEKNPDWDPVDTFYQDLNSFRPILDQKWSYFNKGSQSYVFISEDGAYVLKFFKQHKFKEKTWLALLPFSSNPYHQEYIKTQKKAQDAILSSLSAYQHFPEQTGILFLHFNPSEPYPIEVTDKKNCSHSINLGKTCFILQKKADLIYPRIRQLMHENNPFQAKKIISNVLDLLDLFGRHGVVDNDPILRKNFGLIGDEAIQFDVGRFRMDPTRAQNHLYKRELRHITKSFQSWLVQNFPELSEHFEEALDQIESEGAFRRSK